MIELGERNCVIREEEGGEGTCGPKRKRSRRMVSIDYFNLLQSASGIMNGSESGQTNVMPTDVKKFRRSLNESVIYTDNFHISGFETPYFRCSGGRRRCQKFVCAATIRVKKVHGSGETVRTNVLSLVVEEDSRKVRNLKHDKRENCRGIRTGIAYICSCDLE